MTPPERNEPHGGVGVIVAAKDAEATLAEALESLAAQTVEDWEAIVVVDVGRDDTWAAAERCAADDERIRVLRGPEAGESGARNAGLRATGAEWVLFLDADDVLVPRALELLLAAAGRGVDVVHGGWVKELPGGVELPAEFAPARDMFATLARHPAFVCHACLWRRALVERVGGFDEDMPVCLDWDFWQRIARAGARFTAVREVVARYRLRPNSASADPERLLRYGLPVIDRGHAADPRVPTPDPARAEGTPRESRAGARLAFATHAAGCAIGRGEDPIRLLEQVKDTSDPDLDPDIVAACLAQAVPLGAYRVPWAWTELWGRFEGTIDAFLHALEGQAQAAALAGRTRPALERMAVESSAEAGVATVGSTRGLGVDLEQPCPDIVDSDARRVLLWPSFGGQRLGTVELPLCDGLLPGDVIADAIAAAHFWPLLGEFLQRNVYPHRSPDDPGGPPEERHDRVGWAVFLQELWGLPDWPGERFYAPAASAQPVGLRLMRRLPSRLLASMGGSWAHAEVAEELPALSVRGRFLDVVVTVGGAPLGVLRLEGPRHVGAKELRSLITTRGGHELCRLAVREAVVGRPLVAPDSLRERLREAALRPTQGEVSGHESGFELAPLAAAPASAALVLARHLKGPVGTSTSRRATLPAETSEELEKAAQAAGEPVLGRAGMAEAAHRLVYSPELVWRAPGRPPAGELRPDPVAEETGEVATDRLLILLYHRVASSGSSAGAPYRITPEAFAEQLRYLRDAGFRSTTLDEWRLSMERRLPLAGRRLIITFDDGYCDFATHAWPLLREHGFGALLSIVADEVGGWNRWDEGVVERISLLGWNELARLRDEGLELASHSATHPYLTTLPSAEVAREAARSRSILTRRLGEPPLAFAYPHGETDPVVQHLVGACGYAYGLGARPDPSRYTDDLLALPRIEIKGDDGLASFVAKLGGAELSLASRA